MKTDVKIGIRHSENVVTYVVGELLLNNVKEGLFEIVVESFAHAWCILRDGNVARRDSAGRVVVSVYFSTIEVLERI